MDGTKIQSISFYCCGNLKGPSSHRQMMTYLHMKESVKFKNVSDIFWTDLLGHLTISTIRHPLVFSVTKFILQPTHSLVSPPSLSLIHNFYFFCVVCSARWDTRIHRNPQGPICSITGRWVITVITADPSSRGSVCVLALDTPWATQFQPGSMETDRGDRHAGGLALWLALADFKSLCVCWLWFICTALFSAWTVST